MAVWVLYTTAKLPLFWCFYTTHKVELGRFYTYEDACGYAFNVCGFTTCDQFTVEQKLFKDGELGEML